MEAKDKLIMDNRASERNARKTPFLGSGPEGVADLCPHHIGGFFPPPSSPPSPPSPPPPPPLSPDPSPPPAPAPPLFINPSSSQGAAADGGCGDGGAMSQRRNPKGDNPGEMSGLRRNSRSQFTNIIFFSIFFYLFYLFYVGIAGRKHYFLFFCRQIISYSNQISNTNMAT